MDRKRQDRRQHPQDRATQAQLSGNEDNRQSLSGPEGQTDDQESRPGQTGRFGGSRSPDIFQVGPSVDRGQRAENVSPIRDTIQNASASVFSELGRKFIWPKKTTLQDFPIGLPLLFTRNAGREMKHNV